MRLLFSFYCLLSPSQRIIILYSWTSWKLPPQNKMPRFSRGGSRISFRRGCTRLLLYFNTNKPHSFFCRIPVVLENRRSSRGGGGGVMGAHPLHPPPRSAPDSVFSRGYCHFQELRWAGADILFSEDNLHCFACNFLVFTVWCAVLWHQQKFFIWCE